MAVRAPLSAVALLLSGAAAGLVLAPAAAQSVDDCGPVTVEPDSYQRLVSSDGVARVVVDATNDGGLPGTAWINASGGPDWVVSVDPARVQLNATETRSAEVRASPAAASPGGSPYQLEVHVDLRCGVEGVGSPGSASDEANVDLEVASGGGDPGGGGYSEAGGAVSMVGSLPGMGLLFLGAVAVLSVVGYPVVRRRTRPGLALEVDQPARNVDPGEGTSFPVTVSNPGGKPGTVDLEVGETGDGWSGFLAVSEVDLEPDEERTVHLLVRPPPSPEAGEEAGVSVEASLRDADGRDSVEVRARVSTE